MARRRTYIMLFLLLVCAPAVAWNIAYPSGSWRYKMTVTVETPEGIKTGSAVRQVTVWTYPEIAPSVSASIDVKGEAVVVDLGKRGVLYALLGSGGSVLYGKSIVSEAFPNPRRQRGGGATREGIKYYKYLQAGPKELPAGLYPMFVTFRDPNDFKSVQPVYPRTNGQIVPAYSRSPPPANAPDFEEVFGAGVSLQSVTIEMTFEPITRKIKAYLPSFDEESGYMEWFKTLEHGDPRKIYSTDFKHGVW
jgi:hypothetical protein